MTFQNADTVRNQDTPQNRDTRHIIVEGQTELHLLNNTDKVIDELHGFLEEQSFTLNIEHEC